jgi:predicted metal-binding membrane protein
MTSASALERILKRDRLVVIAGLAAVASLAWAYTLAGVGMGMNAFQMTGMSDAGAASVSPVPWSPVRALVVFAMWLIMMIAMMLPSAAPVVLLFAAIARKRRTPASAEVGAAAFVAGYLAIWAVFSAGAALAQWAFEMSRLLTPMMQSTSAWFDGVLLLAAGVYQLTPLKQACLGRCRQPVGFLTQHWRSGTSGAFRMGVAHGIFCLGCCWFLMALLFMGGVMNLYWIAGIATYVLAEKLLPRQRWLSPAAGWALIALAAAILARAAWAT